MRPIFLTSIPRSGTSLMRYMLRVNWEESREGISLEVIPGENLRLILHPTRHHVRGHAGYFDGLKMWMLGKTCIFLYRDPRDIIVSWSYAVDTVEADHMLSNLEFGNVKNSPDRIGMLIGGLPRMFETFLPWLKQPGVHKIRYEDVLYCPERVMAPIAVELDVPLRTLVKRAQFRGTGTFRTGRVGDWQQEFAPAHQRAFEAGWGNIMKEMGYEA